MAYLDQRLSKSSKQRNFNPHSQSYNVYQLVEGPTQYGHQSNKSNPVWWIVNVKLALACKPKVRTFCYFLFFFFGGSGTRQKHKVYILLDIKFDEPHKKCQGRFYTYITDPSRQFSKHTILYALTLNHNYWLGPYSHKRKKKLIKPWKVY